LRVPNLVQFQYEETTRNSNTAGSYTNKYTYTGLKDSSLHITSVGRIIIKIKQLNDKVRILAQTGGHSYLTTCIHTPPPHNRKQPNMVLGIKKTAQCSKTDEKRKIKFLIFEIWSFKILRLVCILFCVLEDVQCSETDLVSIWQFLVFLRNGRFFTLNS